MECYSTMYDTLENLQPEISQRWIMTPEHVRQVLWEVCVAQWRKMVDQRHFFTTQEQEMQGLIGQLRETCGQAAPDSGLAFPRSKIAERCSPNFKQITIAKWSICCSFLRLPLEVSIVTLSGHP